MSTDSILKHKSMSFAKRIVSLYRYLSEEKHEYIMAKQILRSGTSIGANIAEAQQAQSRPDFRSKLNIALKETSETVYWLRLLEATDYLSKSEFESIICDCIEIEKILTVSIRGMKQ